MYVKTPVSTSWRACRRLDGLHSIARVGRPDVTLGAGSAQGDCIACANADNNQVVIIIMNVDSWLVAIRRLVKLADANADDDCLSMLSWCLDPRAPGLVPAPQRIADDPLSTTRGAWVDQMGLVLLK